MNLTREEFSSPPGHGIGIQAQELSQEGIASVTGFALRITEVARLGNDLHLSFNSLAGTNYVIQSRTDLVSGSWATLPGTTNSGNGSTVQQTLTNAVNIPQQFYRVKQLP